MAAPDYSELDKAIAKQKVISPLVKVLQSFRVEIANLRASETQLIKRVSELEAKVSKWPIIK